MSTATATKVLTDRINRIEVSATMAITAEALKLKAQGIDLADFGAGEPHFSTPQHIKDAAIQAIQQNVTRYTAVAGTPEVRKAIIDRHAADFGTNYTVEECVFTTGGKLALFNAIQVLVDHGDEVILPVPYWVSFKDIIQYAGGKVVFVESDEQENFRITAKMIEAAITPRTKVIILNTPSNPSGAVVSPEDLEAIVRLAHAHGIYVLLDECYVYLNFTGKIVSGGTFTDCKEHVIVLGSLSKTYAMTGWRAGFALGPKQVISAMSKLQSQSTSNAASMVQRASIAALTGSQECVCGDARGLHQAARPRAGGLQDDSRTDLHGARGRVLCVSEHQRVHRQGWRQVGLRSRREAAERGACGGGAGRGVWDRCAHPALLRGVGRRDRQGRAADARVSFEVGLR